MLGGKGCGFVTCTENAGGPVKKTWLGELESVGAGKNGRHGGSTHKVGGHDIPGKNKKTDHKRWDDCRPGEWQAPT